VDHTEDREPRGTDSNGVAHQAGRDLDASELDPFTADRLAEEWDGGQPVRPGDSVSGTINRFSPKDVPDEVWARIEPWVKSAVTAASPRSVLRANDLLTVTAQLFCWAERIGQPLDPVVLLRPEIIDRFVTEGCAHLADGTRTNYRTWLRMVGAAVLGSELYPPRPLPLKRSDVNAPYSVAEVTELVSWARGCSTPTMRRNVWALLAIGLGAGLSAREISRLVGTDVHEQGGLVVLEVVGEKPRTVPVHRLWAGDVLELSCESGAHPFFRPERTRITRNDLLTFIDRCTEKDQDAKFCIQRLRVTWMVGHLAAGVPVGVVAQAAGVAASHLVKYSRFVPLPGESDARRLLAGMP
jgi:hypothetical protein